MKDRIDSSLMSRVLSCQKCKQQNGLKDYFPRDCPPVFSFGDPSCKEIIVVGINPSKAEYDSEFLAKEFDKALESQIKYFERREYRFFDEVARFFEDDMIRTMLGTPRSLWEEVGYLDLVKCVTSADKGVQWNGLRSSEKNKIVENCQEFLEQQLNLYRPRLVIAYGKNVGSWFGVKNSDVEGFDFVRHPKRFEFEYRAIYAPQRQGKHSRPEVNEMKAKIREALVSIRAQSGQH